ncbi:MAG: pilus assembly protein PilM [Tissierellia bacterium]|nr:pilus assembly protein PilM [Tissierellia bacterium]
MRLPSLNKKVLSIDFGGKEIKIVEGQALNKSIHINKAFTVELPSDIYRDGEILNKDSLADEIKKALKDNKVRIEATYGTINSSQIITRNVTIPKVPEKEIPSIIQYQLDDLFPLAPEDYIINPLITGYRLEEVEKIDLLLVGTPRKIVLDHLDLMKDVGLKPLVLDYQSNSMAKLLDFNSSINDFYNTRDMAIASIDLGYINTKLSIVKNGKILVSRVLDIGLKALIDNIVSFFDYSQEEIEEKIFQIENISHNIDEYNDYSRLVNIASTTMNELMEKINVIFKFYTTREIGNTINFILLKGGLSNVNGMDNLFSNYFNIPAVKLSNLDKVKLNGDLSKYSNAIGGLIRIAEVQR